MKQHLRARKRRDRRDRRDVSKSSRASKHRHRRGEGMVHSVTTASQKAIRFVGGGMFTGRSKGTKIRKAERKAERKVRGLL